MIHAHVLNRGPGAVRSPADRLVEAPADGSRRATGPRPRVLYSRHSQSITARAKMTAGENRREVSCLGRMSRLVLRGRASSGYWLTQTCRTIVGRHERQSMRLSRILGLALLAMASQASSGNRHVNGKLLCVGVFDEEYLKGASEG